MIEYQRVSFVCSSCDVEILIRIFTVLLDPVHSDTDSDDFHDHEAPEQSVFAEVLYPFQPVGSQELALEKGTLIEVIKRDPGPWWWGRVKHDAVVLNSNADQPEGWFPKDFVRVNKEYLILVVLLTLFLLCLGDSVIPATSKATTSTFEHSTGISRGQKL